MIALQANNLISAPRGLKRMDLAQRVVKVIRTISSFAKCTVSGICLAAASWAPAGAQSNTNLNFMGVPGIVDMPSSYTTEDADLNISVNSLGDNTQRLGLHFQITPRWSGVFRYARIDGFTGARTFYDRSFDLRFLLAREGRYLPAITVGLQDFGGTGVYGAEYVVASKTFGALRATGGIGWGRLAGRNSFDNPLGAT